MFTSSHLLWILIERANQLIVPGVLLGWEPRHSPTVPAPSETASLLPGALDHGVLFAGVLEAGRRPAKGPAVGAGDGRLDVPLQEVENRVPPGVCEVVVGGALQSLLERYRHMALEGLDMISTSQESWCTCRLGLGIHFGFINLWIIEYVCVS